MPESAREMVRAQANERRQRGEGNVLGKMLLQIFRHALLLPSRQSAVNDGIRPHRAVVDAHKLVQQHETERFGIGALGGLGAFHLGFELHRGLPEITVEEEQPRRERRFGKSKLGIEERRAGVDVEIGDLRQRARLLPAMKLAARWYEGQAE